jgi:hypothetical protein
MDAAVKAFQDHPHSHTPGDNSIEIIEVTAMPGASESASAATGDGRTGFAPCSAGFGMPQGALDPRV